MVLRPPAFQTPLCMRPSVRRPDLGLTPVAPVRPPSRALAVRRCRSPPRMIGPFFPDLSGSNLLKSDIVRREMGALERDYAELARLGTRYETFDREGKVMFVDSALDVVDRFAIFLTRLKLSEEFSAQMFVKQYQVKLQEYGLTIDSLISNTKKSLQMMRDEIDNKP